jgi:hypothetical protein
MLAPANHSAGLAADHSLTLSALVGKRTRRRWTLVIVQTVGAALALAAFPFSPRATGNFLMIPLVAHAPVAAVAVERGALILGTGPVAGSIVVSGDRARLLGPALHAGIALLTAPAALCGEGLVA